MKRTLIREIFIEIETIRVTRKQRVRKSRIEPTNTDVSNHDDSFLKTKPRLEHLFDNLYLRRI